MSGWYFREKPSICAPRIRFYESKGAIIRGDFTRVPSRDSPFYARSNKKKKLLSSIKISILRRNFFDFQGLIKIFDCIIERKDFIFQFHKSLLLGKNWKKKEKIPTIIFWPMASWSPSFRTTLTYPNLCIKNSEEKEYKGRKSLCVYDSPLFHSHFFCNFFTIPRFLAFSLQLQCVHFILYRVCLFSLRKRAFIPFLPLFLSFSLPRIFFKHRQNLHPPSLSSLSLYRAIRFLPPFSNLISFFLFFYFSRHYWLHRWHHEIQMISGMNLLLRLEKEVKKISKK